MAKKKSVQNEAAVLRQQAAEKISAGEGTTQEGLSPEQTQQVIHALREQLIKLEEQNENLRQKQGKLETGWVVNAPEENGSLLSQIFNKVSEIIFVLAIEPDDNFRFISVNQSFLNTTGLTIDQVVGKRYQEVIPEPAHALVLANYQRAIQEKTTVHWEEISIYPAGKRYGEVSVTPVFDEVGRCSQLIGTVHDVTGYKQAEEALRLSQQELAHANNLLLALSRASQAVQSALTTDEVYIAIQNQITQMGYKATGFEFTQDGQSLYIKYINYKQELVRKGEKLVGFSLRDFSFRPRADSIFHRVITQGETVFIKDTAQAVADALPKKLRSLVRPITNLFKLDQSTFSPMKVGDEIIGILSISGPDLTEADNPAITAFSQQAAISLQNARLNERAQQEITERKRAEEKLEEERILLRMLIDNLPDRVYVMDVQGRKILSNMADWQASGGKTMEDVIGKTDFDTYPPGLAQDYWALDKTVIDSGISIINREEPGLDSQGNPVWVLSSKVALRDGQGKVLGLVGIGRDISERKRAEQALRENEQKYRLLVDNASEAIVVAQDGILKFANRTASDITGYSEQELTSRPFPEFVHPDDRGMVIEHYLNRIKGDVDQPRYAFRLTAHDGSIKWVEIGAVLIDWEGKPASLNFLTDITERKQAEEALRALSVRQEAILVAIPDILMEVDNDKVYTWANPAGFEFFGKDVIGEEAAFYFEGEQDTYGQVKPLFSGAENVIYIESWQRRKDGEKRLLAWHCRGLKDSGGNVIGALSLAHDITESRQAEQQLAQYSEHLEEMVKERTRELSEAQEQLVRQERLAVLGQLAGGVGHELRNPLAIILNAVYYLNLVQPDVDDNIKSYYGMIEHEAHTAEKIITDLLDFARIKSMEPEPVAVADLVRQTLQRFPAPPPVEVALELLPDLPPVYADPRQMVQVLGNLTVNACQAMPSGGKLTITAQRQEQMVAIAVKDSGVGIPPENMSKLFEPLFTTKLKGIGLGLAVSQRLAEANGGRIEVVSEQGKGSTFTLVLPVK